MINLAVSKVKRRTYMLLISIQSIVFRQPLKWEQRSLKCIYWMILVSWTMHLINGKEWGESMRDRERERERTDKEWEAECGWERVAVCVIHLTNCQVFMRAQKKYNQWVYQDGNKAYPKNFWWSMLSLSAITFHPSDRLTIYHTSWQVVNKSLRHHLHFLTQGQSWSNFWVHQTHSILENTLRGRSSTILPNSRICFDIPWPAKPRGKMLWA